MSDERTETAQESTLTAARLREATRIFTEQLEGPPCPVCFREDGTHALGCRVPDYIAGWKMIYREHGDRVGDAIFGPREA